MQTFELQFNPKAKEERVFDSFCFEAGSPTELPLGNLYIVGELDNVLPQNTGLLQKLSLIIKEEYYADPQKNPEFALKDSLKAANEFLNKEAKGGNVSWMGNLSLACLSFQNFVLNFTKTGNLKMLLVRNEEILDVGQNVEFQDIQPYPMKVFGSMVTGKLAAEDKLLIMTQEVFSALNGKKENLLSRVAQISEEKEIRGFFNNARPALAEVSGTCLFCLVGRERAKSQFSWQAIFPFRIRLNRNIASLFILSLILIAGFYIFQAEKEQSTAIDSLVLKEAEEKILLAESVLIFNDEEKALLLFQEALDIVAPLIQKDSPLKKRAVLVKESIEENLAKLNSQ